MPHKDPEARKEYNRLFYYRKGQKEKKQAYQKANRARLLENERRYELRNREARLARGELYRQNQRRDNAKNFYARVCAATARWRKANPEKAKDSQHNSNAKRRIRLKRNFVERIERAKVYQRDKGRCHVCGQAVPFTVMHVDHLVPLCVNGRHAYDNVAVTCAPCNLRRPRKRYRR